jgi:hypothetical protein
MGPHTKSDRGGEVCQIARRGLRQIIRKATYTNQLFAWLGEDAALADEHTCTTDQTGAEKQEAAGLGRHRGRRRIQCKGGASVRVCRDSEGPVGRSEISGVCEDGIGQDASTRHRLIRKTQRAVRSAGGDVGDVKGERLVPIHDREQRLTVGAAVEREAVERDRLKGQARQASRSADDNAGRSEVNAGGRERITPCDAEGTGDGAGQSKRRGCAEDYTDNQKMHQFLHETP